MDEQQRQLVEEGLRDIKENTRLVIDRLGPLSGLDFGLNRDSVAWVDGFIERQRERPEFDPENIDGLVNVIGSFLGECIVSATGGRWECSEEHGWGVRLGEEGIVFPFVKVRKQFTNGIAGGDSILSFYNITVTYLATGRLRRRSAETSRTDQAASQRDDPAQDDGQVS
ncbi:hypothetical protein [Thermostaphylospora chromogena]|uniref:Uncharacterized protein n=1 Tax=Thermostaphylospora chromogena TaxID=35622 RepID=A0A1H1H6M6_9ACTN|nr:hypothetical protein [Thermostaphylospora chromogena]SDR21064.1 hypothetical protein SAMN04489764_4105 [Thermostaphylospora chromogena]